MTCSSRLLFASASLVAVVCAGCGRLPEEPTSATSNGSPAASSEPDAITADANEIVQPADDKDADDVWRGLERHEIQLDQKLLVVKGSKGVIGCPYLSAASFEKFGEACAIIPAVDTAGMLNSKVTAVTPKAKELGIEVGMPGREALDKIR